MNTKPKGPSLMNKVMSVPESAVVMVLAIMVAIVGIVEPKFFRVTNLMDVLRNASYSFIIAAPLTLNMMSGGGSGSLFGSFLGCILIAVIKNGLVLMQVSSYWQNLVFGIILVLSLYIDKMRRARIGGGA